MESLVSQRVIFIVLFIAYNPVHCFDIYLSPESSPGSSQVPEPQSPANYFSYPPGYSEPPSKSSSYPPLGDSDSPSQPVSASTLQVEPRKVQVGEFQPGQANARTLSLDSISLYGGADDEQSLHSISSGRSANTKNNGISDTQISKADVYSVLEAKKGNNANPELKKICDKTDYSDLCLSTIGPRLGSGTNTHVVLEVAIKASYELAKVGNAMAKKLAMTPGTSDQTASHIKDCQDSFDDTLYNFDLALKAFQNHDVGTMNSMLSAVITDMSDCNDSLAATGSPLTNIGDKLANMTSNCLAIISQMQ